MALLLCLAFLGVPDGQAHEPATVLIGEENLREGVPLRDQWRFRPGDDLAWARPALDDGSWDTVSLPHRWPLGGYPEQGHMAWYRLTLNIDPALLNTRLTDTIAIRMGKVYSAYEIYVEGRHIGGVGRLPPLSELDYDRQRVFTVPSAVVAGDGRMVVALRVWGGEPELVNGWTAGPVTGDFILGYSRELMIDSVIGALPGVIFAMLTLAFGLYHLYLYSRNRSLNTFFWFGLLACNIAIYGLMITQWKYVTEIPFVVMKKIEFGALYVAPAIVMQMVWSLLQSSINRWLRVYQLSFVAVSLLVILVPGHTVHYHTLGLWRLWILPAMLLVPWLLLVAARGGNREARTVLLGFIVFLAAALNDLLIDWIHLDSTLLAPLGFMAVLVAMAVSLANRFTNMYGKLEQEVAQRTAELSAANQQLARVARLDHLTGLLNRRGFIEEAQSEIRRFERMGKPFSLVLADVDNFKRFNDAYGHVCGDHVLNRLATLLRSRLREIDQVGRWGGEEFIMLLPVTDTEGATVVAEKMRQAVAGSAFEFDNQQLAITMTFGLATFGAGDTLDACVARADSALYRGKASGRNKVMVGIYKGLTLVN